MILICNREMWLANGVEHVDLPEYDLYLSWPNQTNPNKVFLLNENDEVGTKNSAFNFFVNSTHFKTPGSIY